MGKKNRAERGVSYIEFTIVVPVLFFILIGIFDLSAIFSHRSSISEAARTAVRTAAVMRFDEISSCDDITARVIDVFQQQTGLDDVSNAEVCNESFDAVDRLVVRARVESDYPCYFCGAVFRGLRYDSTFIYPLEDSDLCSVGQCL